METKRIYPRIKLRGNDLLRRSGIVYTQILGDLLLKVDEGEGDYPRGFFHTSTVDYTVPNYYDQMWSRDVGRGLMELIRAGFLREARMSIDYIMERPLNCGDHFARRINMPGGDFEIDGNVNMLLAFYMLWKYEGRDKAEAKRILDFSYPVLNWFRRLADESPWRGLMKSQSELSGNPDTPYFVYALFATYGAVAVCRSYLELAAAAFDNKKAEFIKTLHDDIKCGLKKYLISEGEGGEQATKTPAGVWINGIDERNGKAAEEGDFGPKFDIHRWTRQLPFIQDIDAGSSEDDELISKINAASYEYIKGGMCEGYYFRRYGFVSNTCFGGMGGRHDDTMAGYGQNFFTQASLVSDDINVYTKCLEGIARLAYDGDVVTPLTVDLNPWVMHECFSYENYERALDHTFGAEGVPEKMIMHNPGDEGNLVQSAETLKSFALVAGISSDGDTVNITPRLPWECDFCEVKAYPVPSPAGVARICYKYTLDREENRYRIEISGLSPFKKLRVRLGALPNVLFAEKEISQEWTLTRTHEATFAEKTLDIDGDAIMLELVNER